MKFCICGTWKEIVVDDYFPTDKVGEPAFAKATGNELWVMLLEKAWAKINGNYENTISGNPVEAFNFLEPAVNLYVDHNFVEDAWFDIFDGNKKDFIMCGGSGKPNTTVEELQQHGLVNFYAYSIINAQNV